MSRENVEIVRRWIESYEDDTETFRELMHPEIEWAPFEQNHTVFHGQQGAEQVRTGWLDAWAEHHIEVEDIIDAGDDLVVVMHLVGRGKGSGIEIDVRLYPHIRLKDGKAVYVFEYEDRAAALKAVGLAE
ncbi:MAG TPA: nuclear transport factor 2 family protein [Solirubrobacteraceae bacterium]|nr:nuclear transport factor 2 family protein [Solirubrobacteraceae bacterium]